VTTERHRRTSKSAVTATLILAAVSGCSDAVSPEDATDPSHISVSAAVLRSHVEALAHDSACGRLAGTAYETEAAEYVRAAFVEAGLAPGAAEAYVQVFPLGPISQQPPPDTDRCRAQTRAASRNVLGTIPGVGALAEQWVILGAHYDHVGWTTDSGGGAIVLNGADDNASGTTVLLVAADLLARWLAAHPEAAPSRRSIMFQAYGAEEEGMLGSRYYVGNPTVPGDSVLAMVNLDMVGRLHDGQLIVGGVSTSTGWPTLLSAWQPEGVTYRFGDEGLGRSDQASFLTTWQTPVLHLFTGLHQDYHTPRDDPPLVNYVGMQAVTRLVLGLLWDLATRPDAL
jgi:Zn-dependent M28 family amino/carboxypeptidase